MSQHIFDQSDYRKPLNIYIVPMVSKRGLYVCIKLNKVTTVCLHTQVLLLLSQYSELTYASRRLDSSTTRLFVQQLAFRLTTNEALKLYITGPLRGAVMQRAFPYYDVIMLRNKLCRSRTLNVLKAYCLPNILQNNSPTDDQWIPLTKRQ